MEHLHTIIVIHNYILVRIFQKICIAQRSMKEFTRFPDMTRIESYLERSTPENEQLRDIRAAIEQECATTFNEMLLGFE